MKSIKPMKKIVCACFMLCITLSAFAGGAPEPETEIYLNHFPVYISPGNPEIGRDVLITAAIQIDIDDNVSIRRYELRIYDKIGQIIYVVSEENLEGRGFPENIFNVDGLPLITIPKTIIWDGRNNDGVLVDDGEYFYQIYVRDSNDNLSFTAPLLVVVDRVSPEIISLNTSGYIFSPNNDGSQDSVSFFIQTGPAESWVWKIQDASGTPVFTDSVVSQGDTAASDVPAPSNVEWNGENSSGVLQGEGKYRFILEGTDRAGNIVQRGTDIILSTAAANIELTISDNNPYFSLNERESMDILVSLNNTDGLSRWEMDITDSEGIIFRRFAGSSADLPRQLEFDGRGNSSRPESGALPLDDGVYTAAFLAYYGNGNVSASAPLTIVMDSTAPEAYLMADSAPIKSELGDPLYFGGESRPYLIIDANYDESINWDVVATYEQGEDIVEPLQDFLDAGFTFPFTWDGTNPFTGYPIPDGSYQVFLRASDAAGNVGISNVARFRRDGAARAATAIGLSVPQEGLVRMTPVVPVSDGIKHFIINVVNEEDGQMYYVRQLRQALPYLDWNGSRNNNRPAPPGPYRAELDILYFNGDRIVVRSSDIITLGTNGPTLGAVSEGDSVSEDADDIVLDDSLFSPDGDGVNDTKRIGLQTSVGNVRSWSLDILDSSANLFRSWSGNDRPPKEVIWDGLSDNSELVQSGSEYTVVFNLIDGEGNVAISSDVIPIDILIIADGDRFKIRVSSIHFAANTEDLFDVDPDEQMINFTTLRRLAKVLNRYPNYNIVIEGHASQILSGLAGQWEQVHTLIPLSRNRALEVKQALSILGVDWERMAIRGLGGSMPVVPYANTRNRWKNRRVEFILDR
ncbi:MAG: OmpA family protein [Salinispira sp.]